MSIKTQIINAVGSLFPARIKEAIRNKSGSSFQENSSVALVFKNFDETYLKSKKKFAQHIKEKYRIKNVFILTYLDGDSEDVPIYLSHLKELDYFCKEDLNWRQEPKKMIADFCTKEFDVLIDLTHEPCSALEHIVAGSRSKMKVGRKGSVHEKYMDLMIEISPSTGEDDFLKYVEYYLSKLKFN